MLLLNSRISNFSLYSQGINRGHSPPDKKSAILKQKIDEKRKCGLHDHPPLGQGTPGRQRVLMRNFIFINSRKK